MNHQCTMFWKQYTIRSTFKLEHLWKTQQLISTSHRFSPRVSLVNSFKYKHVCTHAVKLFYGDEGVLVVTWISIELFSFKVYTYLSLYFGLGQRILKNFRKCAQQVSLKQGRYLIDTVTMILRDSFLISASWQMPYLIPSYLIRMFLTRIIVCVTLTFWCVVV